MVDTVPFATRWQTRCRVFPPTSARFMTCVRPLHRWLSQTCMPEKNATNRDAGCVRLNVLEKNEQTQKPRPRAFRAWQSGALTDDGKPSLDADGLQVEERLRAIDDSIRRVAETRGSPTN